MLYLWRIFFLSQNEFNYLYCFKQTDYLNYALCISFWEDPCYYVEFFWFCIRCIQLWYYNMGKLRHQMYMLAHPCSSFLVSKTKIMKWFEVVKQLLHQIYGINVGRIYTWSKWVSLCLYRSNFWWVS